MYTPISLAFSQFGNLHLNLWLYDNVYMYMYMYGRLPPTALFGLTNNTLWGPPSVGHLASSPGSSLAFQLWKAVEEPGDEAMGYVSVNVLDIVYHVHVHIQVQS